MRELAAKWVAVSIGVVIMGLAAGFAQRQNATTRSAPPHGATAEAPVPPPSEPVDAASVRRGRSVYDDAGCARCHAVDGRGNPRSPLDGVGLRLTEADIRAHVLADETASADFSRSVIRAKEAFRELPDDDMRALVLFLTTLR